MEDKLNTLIAYFEEEKIKLIEAVSDYVKEEEYQFAHFYHAAVIDVDTRLQILISLRDPQYTEKTFKEREIQFLEKELKSESSDYRRKYLTKSLVKEKDELNLLNKIPKAVESFGVTILNQTILDLLEKKIKSFTLILRKKDKFVLNFSYLRKTLKVALPAVKLHKKRSTLTENHIYLLEKLGFDLLDNKSKLVIILSGDKQQIIDKLKIILIKIVFEIFNYREFENETYIKIKGKDNN